jgi:hypothetical protein
MSITGAPVAFAANDDGGSGVIAVDRGTEQCDDVVPYCHTQDGASTPR